jgi:hypothetical protein
MVLRTIMSSERNPSEPFQVPLGHNIRFPNLEYLIANGTISHYERSKPLDEGSQCACYKFAEKCDGTITENQPFCEKDVERRPMDLQKAAIDWVQMKLKTPHL